jgi:tRNA(fMet)-specific endonuclease VapC
MTGRYLLDTNVIIALFANDSAVVTQVRAAAEVFVSSIVLGELYYGAQNSSRPAENIARIEQFRAANTILVCDALTAMYYGQIKISLKRRGTPIPENDIWIAALAMQFDLILATHDRHFQSIDTIKLVAW